MENMNQQKNTSHENTNTWEHYYKQHKITINGCRHNFQTTERAAIMQKYGVMCPMHMQMVLEDDACDI